MVGASPGTPASSTTKTGHHDIAEILLKVALNTINQNQIEQLGEGTNWYPVRPVRKHANGEAGTGCNFGPHLLFTLVAIWLFNH